MHTLPAIADMWRDEQGGNLVAKDGESLLREFIREASQVGPGDNCAELCASLARLIEISLKPFDDIQAAPHPG